MNIWFHSLFVFFVTDCFILNRNNDFILIIKNKNNIKYTTNKKISFFSINYLKLIFLNKSFKIKKTKNYLIFLINKSYNFLLIINNIFLKIKKKYLIGVAKKKMKLLFKKLLLNVFTKKGFFIKKKLLCWKKSKN